MPIISAIVKVCGCRPHEGGAASIAGTAMPQRPTARAV
jgi:hypothetical protein